MKDPYGNVLYFDCINVNILEVILYYSHTRWYHWGKLGKEHMLILHITFTTVCESKIISQLNTSCILKCSPNPLCPSREVGRHEENLPQCCPEANILQKKALFSIFSCILV